MIQAHRKNHAILVMETFGNAREEMGTISVTVKTPLGNQEISRLNKLAVEEKAEIQLKRSGTAITISCK